jgi:hypothetical protein
LRQAGATVELIEAGCCGMAGPFGFEADKFEVSKTIANQGLLPAVQAAGSMTIIVADGFSCREQIAQCTDRHSLHLAEVIAAALKGGLSSGSSYPEAPHVARRRAELDGSMKRSALALAGVAAGAALLWWLKSRR